MTALECAVIGTGWCGGIRAETLSRSALCKKLHICEIRPDRLAEVKALTNPATATLDYHDITKNDDISVVYISTTPESTHYPIARDCLRAGKHVLLEKPIAMELFEADELIETAKRHKLKFTIGYSQRFNTKFAYAKKKITDGTLGKPVSVMVSRHVSRTLGKKIASRVRLSPAAMESTHDLDVVFWLLEPAKPVRVYSQGAYGYMQPVNGSYDIMWTTVSMDTGVLVAFDGGRSTVRKLIDMPFEGFTYPEYFLVAGTRFDFRARIPDLCSVNYTADPVEWFLLLQIPDMWRVILPADETLSPDDAVSEQSLQSSLQNILRRDEAYDIVVSAIYRVHQRVAARYRRDRVFLAGDAAHLNNPLGGMGLNGGLHDVISLTDRLIAWWHGKADASVLDGYEPQRRPEAINAIHAITARNKRLLEERDPEIRTRNLRDLQKTAGDPALHYQYLLDAAMISSLRRSGMIE